MNRFTSDRKIRKRLESGPVAPEPPADLLEKIQGDIPRNLGEGDESDPADRWRSAGRPGRRLLAASLATAIAGGVLAYLVMERALAPGDEGAPTGAVAREGELLKALKTTRPERPGVRSQRAPDSASPDPSDELERPKEARLAPPAAANETLREREVDSISAGADPDATAPPAAVATRPEPQRQHREPPPTDHETAEGKVKVLEATYEDHSEEAPQESPHSPAPVVSAEVESETLHKFSSERSAAPPAVAGSFRPARAGSDGGTRDRAPAEDAPDSYALVRSYLEAGRLPPQDEIRVEEFAAAFAAAVRLEAGSPFERLAADFAEILHRSDAARADDLRNLLERLEELADGTDGRHEVGELTILARRALSLLEAAERAPED